MNIHTRRRNGRASQRHRSHSANCHANTDKWRDDVAATWTHNHKRDTLLTSGIRRPKTVFSLGKKKKVDHCLIGVAEEVGVCVYSDSEQEV